MTAYAYSSTDATVIKERRTNGTQMLSLRS